MTGTPALPVAPATSAKFAPDGSARRYPGNTIVADPRPDDPAFATLAALAGKLAALPAAGAHVFLPPASHHMTLFRGVNDRLRRPGEWPLDLPLDLPLEAVTGHFVRRLQGVRLPGVFRMRPVALAANASGELQLALAGADAAEEARLAETRALLAERLRHRRSGDGHYRFHVTLSYRVRPADPGRERELARAAREAFAGLAARFPVLTLGAAALCDYEDMLVFRERLPLAAP